MCPETTILGLFALIWRRSRTFLAADGTQLAMRQFSKNTSSLSCSPWHLPVQRVHLHILTMVRTSIMRMHMRFCSREFTNLISDGTVMWVHQLFSRPVYQVLQYRTHPLSLTYSCSISELPWKEVITSNWLSGITHIAERCNEPGTFSLSGCLIYQFLHSLSFCYQATCCLWNIEEVDHTDKYAILKNNNFNGVESTTLARIECFILNRDLVWAHPNCSWGNRLGSPVMQRSFQWFNSHASCKGT